MVVLSLGGVNALSGRVMSHRTLLSLNYLLRNLRTEIISKKLGMIQ